MSKPFLRISKLLVKTVRMGNNEQRNRGLWIMPKKVTDTQKHNKQGKGKRERTLASSCSCAPTMGALKTQQVLETVAQRQVLQLKKWDKRCM